MNTSLIPWKEFLDTLKQQSPATLELWLRSWLFANEGVIEADPKLAAVCANFHIADSRNKAPARSASAL
jgi:hypothetical protein